MVEKLHKPKQKKLNKMKMSFINITNFCICVCNWMTNSKTNRTNFKSQYLFDFFLNYINIFCLYILFFILFFVDGLEINAFAWKCYKKQIL